MKTAVALALTGASLAWAQSTLTYATSRPPESTIEPSLTAIESAEATATAISPKSNVEGVAFNRFFQIWLENIDYDKAAGDPNMEWLATQGITLTNYYATTHPSEPNYCAAAAGDNFGMDNDDFHIMPSNISTIADVLDTKGISWAEYQEHIPYPGFQGFNYSNQQTYANDYVRKHNPLILFDSVTSNATRLSLIKNFTSFYDDINSTSLLQWAFITPNMTNDAHDTTITFGAAWERGFVSQLLNNTYFMNNTLLLLTFDENESYTIGNKVFSILLGGAVPDSLKNTTDDTFYTHYSALSTVEANWGLPSLGRWDCGANIFELVANKTGYKNKVVDTSSLYFNSSYPGPVSDAMFIAEWPVPDVNGTCAAGNGVLEAVKTAWGNAGAASYNYTAVYPYDEKSDNNGNGSAVVSASSTASGSASSTGSSTASAASATKSSGASAAVVGASTGVVGLVAGVFAMLML